MITVCLWQIRKRWLLSTKNNGVPAEITTNDGGSIAPGVDLVAYISQLVDESTQASSSSKGSSSKGSSGGDTTQNVDTQKQRAGVTWWRQFKYYCCSCGVAYTMVPRIVPNGRG